MQRKRRGYCDDGMGVLLASGSREMVEEATEATV